MKGRGVHIRGESWSPPRLFPRRGRGLLGLAGGILGFAFALSLALLAGISGCSIQKMATRSMAESLAKGSSVYATDDDPELVAAALPFGLKLIESMLVELPRDRELLVAGASGFTQYANGFLELEALEVESVDHERARALRLRAKHLYLRARDYGVRALELTQPEFQASLRLDATSTLARFKGTEVPELYWTAAAWASAIGADKEDLDLVADLPLIEPMLRRCLELDQAYDHGALHEFMLAFKGGLSDAQGGSVDEARAHFRRARELSGGRKISPLVSLAETVAVRLQDRAEFRRLLGSALAFDAESAPEYRLANLLAQRRAELLLERIDDLFLEP